LYYQSGHLNDVIAVIDYQQVSYVEECDLSFLKKVVGRAESIHQQRKVALLL